jgi:hypothetical protein
VLLDLQCVRIACIHSVAAALYFDTSSIATAVAFRVCRNALGRVFKSKKDPAKASECFALALKLQNTAPALPFEMVELKI